MTILIPFTRGTPDLTHTIDLFVPYNKYQLIKFTTDQFWWSIVDGAEKWDLDLMKKKETEKYADHPWQSYQIENSWMVWEWWRAKAPTFSHFS